MKFRKKVVAIIQARMASTRLPGKVLMPMVGKPALQWCVERVKRAKKVHEVIVATTTNPKDVEIVVFCQDVLKVKLYSGSEDDVLGRVYAAAQLSKADYIVDITADCPLVDPADIDEIVSQVKSNNNYIYGSNINPRRWPDGFDIQVYPIDSLRAVNFLINNPVHRCHGGWNILNNINAVATYLNKKNEYEIALIPEGGRDYAFMEVTLDTQEDLMLINKVLSHFYNTRKQDTFTMFDVIEFLTKSNLSVNVKRKTAGEG